MFVCMSLAIPKPLQTKPPPKPPPGSAAPTLVLFGHCPHHRGQPRGAPVTVADSAQRQL